MNAPSAGPRGPSSRARRIVTGFAILAAFLPLVWADAVGAMDAPAGRWLLPVALLLAAGGAGEIHRMLLPAGAGRAWTALGAAAVPLGAALASPAFLGREEAATPLSAAGGAAAALVVVTILGLAAEIARYRPDTGALERVSAAALAGVFVGLPMAAVVGLRVSGTPSTLGGWHAPGMTPLVAMIAAAKGADVAAYLAGSTFGRRKMAPALSPGKTWEGAAGAVAGALVASWIVLVALRRTLAIPDGSTAMPLGGWAAHGILVAIAGMAGDLAESLLKRETGIKDSGTTLGALGGVLDLVDSLLFAAPVAWLLWTVAPPS